MKRALPKEQDKLLKELKYLENRVENKDQPEKRYVLFGLSVIATISFILIGLNDYYYNNSQYLAGIIILWILLSFSILACYFGNFIGYVAALLISVSMNLALSYSVYKTQTSYQSLSLIADLFVLVLATSSFRNKGYIVSILLLVSKNVYFLFMPGVEINYVSVLVDTIIILITGTFLLMIMYLFRLADKARMQMLRAEILALQNQELIGSWEGFFKK